MWEKDEVFNSSSCQPSLNWKMPSTYTRAFKLCSENVLVTQRSTILAHLSLASCSILALVSRSTTTNSAAFTSLPAFLTFFLSTFLTFHAIATCTAYLTALQSHNATTAFHKG